MIRPVQKDLYAVIGNPVEHSLSPVMMNAVFEALKIPAVYLALQVDDVEEDLPTLSRLGVRGLSVTIPHKESAYRLAVGVDEPARVMGAVNTLRLHGTQWEGCNTDWIGAITALRREMDHLQPPGLSGISPANPEHPLWQTKPLTQHPALSTQHSAFSTHHSSLITHHYFSAKHALIIGAGGVARAVVYGLKREGASITISNRGVERGEALARAFNSTFVPLSELQQANQGATFDIIVQCTSVGLSGGKDFALIPDSPPPKSPDPTAINQAPRAKSQQPTANTQEPTANSTLIPDSLLHPGALVMDTVYRPLWTPFLRRARAAGCITISGLEMLLHQGVAQLQWWFGEIIRPEAVLPVMRKALMKVFADE